MSFPVYFGFIKSQRNKKQTHASLEAPSWILVTDLHLGGVSGGRFPAKVWEQEQDADGGPGQDSGPWGGLTVARLAHRSFECRECYSRQHGLNQYLTPEPILNKVCVLASFFKTVFKIFIILKIYLAALGLSDGMWDLVQRSVPDQRSNLGPCVLGAES